MIFILGEHLDDFQGKPMIGIPIKQPVSLDRVGVFFMA